MNVLDEFSFDVDKVVVNIMLLKRLDLKEFIKGLFVGW